MLTRTCCHLAICHSDDTMDRSGSGEIDKVGGATSTMGKSGKSGKAHTGKSHKKGKKGPESPMGKSASSGRMAASESPFGEPHRLLGLAQGDLLPRSIELVETAVYFCAFIFHPCCNHILVGLVTCSW